jgi:NAD+ synthase (glutamine-hydrolysing)
LIAEYDKQCLPNYQVFDEKRYFTAGSEACVVSIHGISVALTICEDIWHDEPVAQAKAAGASVLININASPFPSGKAVGAACASQHLCRRASITDSLR